METLNRRELLKISGFAGALAALSVCQAENALTPAAAASVTPAHNPSPVAQIDDEDWLIHQTLRRITFGPRIEEIERAKEIGLDNFIDEQLAPKTIDDTEMGSYLSDIESIFMSPEELLEIEQRGQPVRELIQTTLLRAIHSKRQLYELMVDFWSNHFNLYVRKSFVGLLKIIDDRDVIRPHALGNFHDILSGSAHSPAMLVYLDNAQSNQRHPNENYARELLELHTLGVSGGYTHKDVEEVARALTGWSVTNPRDDKPGYFQYRSRLHDNGEKTILGQTFPAGQGIEDGEQLLEMLAEHPSTAQYISEKLVRRFVSDDPPVSLVSQAAETFNSTSGNIQKVMSTILHSEEFRASLGSKFKRPYEYTVSALRVTGAQTSVERSPGSFLTQMGQPLFNWAPPNGFPDNADAWSTTNGMLARWNYALSVSFNATRDTELNWDDLINSTNSTSDVISTLSNRLLGAPLSDDSHQVVLEFANKLNPDIKIQAIGALLIASPQFQYR
ncbi:MAG: DUF1800 domain-containing protein [Anaerolineales bacterium]|nr:DUF1800 domain-containing protein [Chloroflexota bacterium]MBL6982242.1 DUF1800 domain-containing protein [Anaerolineales bacterium]